MNWIESVVLGVVQGLTEFLPVSSSGHLVLFQHMFGLKEPELLFDISLHVGTLAAVLIVFHKDLLALTGSLVRMPAMMRSGGGIGAWLKRDADLRLFFMIVAGSIPTAILGLFFAKMAEQLFATVWLVGITLCITGVLLWLTRARAVQGRDINAMLWRDALIIGLAQGLAITPGISRSGTTIAVALFLGLQRELAGRFSFLLSIPAILGALVLGLDGDAFKTAVPVGFILMGSLVAALVGYLALTILLRMVKNGQLHCFAPYCWAVGAVAFMITFF